MFRFMLRVYSVGVSREPAGGVVEAAARLDRRLVSPSTAKFRWSSVVDQLLSACSLLRGVAVHGSPVPEFERWRIRWLNIWRRLVMLDGATTMAAMGAGPSGPLTNDFPFRLGAASIQGVSEQRRTARHRLVHGAGIVGLQRGLVVISFSV
jgi:hypothetical protein